MEHDGSVDPCLIREELEIREMTLDDLPPVYRLGELLFTADRWPVLYRTWDEYDLAALFAAESEQCFVADFRDQVIGFALGTFIEKRRSSWRYGYLLWLGTDPAYRGMGVARKLLRRFTQHCVEEGARMMLVDTAAENEDAIRFFRREGYGNDQEHVYLSKNLTNTAAYRRFRHEQRERD